MKLDLLKQLADMVSMCGNGAAVKESVEPLFDSLIVSLFSFRMSYLGVSFASLSLDSPVWAVRLHAFLVKFSK